MYYRLAVDLILANVYLKRGKGSAKEKLLSGRALAPDDNLSFRWIRIVDRDEKGERDEPRMDAYFPEARLMEKRLVATLQGVGVTNLQTFPAVIEDPETGEVIEDYVAVNVVGMVSCADVGASDGVPIDDAYLFRNLVIDPAKTHGLLMFRLAESQIEIIIEEKLAKAIEDGDFVGMALEPLAETPP